MFAEKEINIIDVKIHVKKNSAPSTERKLSVEKKGNKYNTDEDQQLDDVLLHFAKLSG
jgi:hypothetical protein